MFFFAFHVLGIIMDTPSIVQRNSKYTPVPEAARPLINWMVDRRLSLVVSKPEVFSFESPSPLDRRRWLHYVPPDRVLLLNLSTFFLQRRKIFPHLHEV